MTGFAARNDVDETEFLRAQVYALLGRLLMAPPDAALLHALAAVPPDATPLGKVLGALGKAAAATAQAPAEREYNALFIGVTRGEVVPYASYYRTGFLNDRPLAEVRADMAILGLSRAPGVPEPEDHLGALCQTMAALIAHDHPLDAQKTFFGRHIASWGGLAFADIEKAPSAAFYRPVGAIGRLLLTIEEDAFVLQGG